MKELGPLGKRVPGAPPRSANRSCCTIHRIAVLGLWSWSCGFESDSTGYSWCGMVQEQDEDKFDWSIIDKGTPSSNTGPEQAYAGRHYIYIEASNPRQQYDNAM